MNDHNRAFRYLRLHLIIQKNFDKNNLATAKMMTMIPCKAQLQN